MPTEIGMSLYARGRKKAKLYHASRPPRPRLRKRIRPHLRKTLVISRIPGTRGIWAVLARRLGCVLSTCQRALSRPGWENVLQAFEQERLVALDQCQENVFDLADCSGSDQIRFQANTFILEKTHPDYQPTRKVTLEGGDNPIKIQAVTFNVPAEMLQAPVSDRIKVLEMIDDAEEVDGR